MFTDGLDPTALQWVREGLDASPFPPSGLAKSSPTLPRKQVYGSQPVGKGWDLPPSQLINSVHLHSDFLVPNFCIPSTPMLHDDLEESVGSISEKAFNQGYEDFADTLDEQDSGDYSANSSPGGSVGVHMLSREQEQSNYQYTFQSKQENTGFVLVDTWSRPGEGQGDSEKDHAKLQPSFVDSGQPCLRREGDDEDESLIGPFMRSSSKSSLHGHRWQNEANLNGCRPDQSTIHPSTGTMNREYVYRDKDVDDDSKVAQPPLQTKPNSIYPTHIFCELDHFQMDHPSCKLNNSRVQTNVNGVTLPEMPKKNRFDLPPSAPPMVSSMGPGNNYEDDLRTSGSKVSHRQASCERVQYPSAPLTPSVQNDSLDSQQKRNEQSAHLDSPSCTRRNHPGLGAQETGASSVRGPCSSLPSVYPSGQASWQKVIAYDACVRLCLGAWARGCVEAPEFLQNECYILRNSFGLQQLLLQPQEEATKHGHSDHVEAIAAAKPKRDVGKVKVQVRKLKIMPKNGSRTCKFPNLAAIFSYIPGHSDPVDKRHNGGSFNLMGWATMKKIFMNRVDYFRRAPSQRNNSHSYSGIQYMKQVSSLLKAGVNTLRNSTLSEVSQESFSCLIRLKSSSENEGVRMQPGSADTLIFYPESFGDDLLIEIQDLKGNANGRAVVQLSSLGDDMNDRVRWWSLYNQPEHDYVGKVQLFISYTMTSGEIGTAKWGAVGETVAYDIVLEVALKVQKFQRRNLHIQGSWCWLLSEFATHYGVSDAYTKLRYLACIMDVATPTEDCLILIHHLLVPIIKARDESALDRQEKRILGEVEEQVSQLLSMVFENYKSLDDSSPSGLSETIQLSVGSIAPALVPAVQIYALLQDILSLEAQTTLRNYFQTAARKRCKRHMAETDEFVSNSSEGFLMDPLTLSAAYLKMKNLCLHIREEVLIDIGIHNQHVLPSSIDLPNITATIYSGELCNRLRTFLVACPPSSPSPPVTDLLIATADFQGDLASWHIRSTKGGVDAKDLFHLYIVLWIQDKHLQLLELCKLDRVRLTAASSTNGAAPFVEEIYDRIKDTLNEYEVIVSRWPEYTFVLENAIADVERAVIAALEKHFADVLAPLKDVMVPKRFGLQYMQKIAQRRSISLYVVPNEIGVVLNTVKRLLDTLRPKMEAQMKAWVACLPVDGNAAGRTVFGEQLNEVTLALRTRYKSFVQAVVEKLADNARIQRSTNLKKILEETKYATADSELRERMQPLTGQLLETIAHLHGIFTTRVFVAVCRGYWDRMAQDVLQLLENRKENRSWYKSSCFVLGIIDDIFASQMQRLQGHALQEKDLEPPRSVMEARSMLSKDARNDVDPSNYMFF